MTLEIHSLVASRPNPPKPEGEGGDFFGYLAEPISLTFGDGRLRPVSNFDAVREWVHEHRHVEHLGNQEGTLYPPTVETGVFDPVSGGCKGVRKHSAEPALLHRVPASHMLELANVPSGEKERRLGIAGFVMHLVGFLFDTRLQFHNWWFDTAVPIAETSIDPQESVAADFITRGLALLRTWPSERQRFVTNLLFMHCRASSYRWHWERFAAEYTVTDACYRLAHDLGHAKASRHAERICVMASRYGIRLDLQHEATVNRIVRRRNALIHEALWDGEQPSGGGGGQAIHDVYSLHKLNQRLICAVLGYRNTWVSSAWESMGHFVFDKAP